MKFSALIIVIYLFMSLFIKERMDFIEFQQLEQVVILAVLWFIYYKNKKVFPSCLATFLLYYFWVFVTDRFIDNMPIYLSFIELSGFLFFLLFQIEKKMEFKADKYNKDYVYLIFFKPRTLYQWSVSLLGSPYASMGSIIDNKVYRLKHGKSSITESLINISYIEKNYLIINTGTKCKYVIDVPEKLKKQTARSLKRFYSRTKCVESQKPLLDRLEKKWHYKSMFDFIPSVYLYRRLKK